MCRFHLCYGLFLLLHHLQITSLFFSSVFNKITGFCSSRSCCNCYAFVFSMFVYTFEKFILLIWNVLLNATKGGNIILKIYSIPVNFGLFKVLEKPLAIDPPVPLSVSNIPNVSHKPTYSSKTPSADAYKLSHLVFTPFLLSW